MQEILNVKAKLKGCNTCRRRKKGVCYSKWHISDKQLIPDPSVISENLHAKDVAGKDINAEGV
jgi:hypothetical protein